MSRFEDPLTRAQTDLIRDWIDEGAVWPTNAVIVTDGKLSLSAARGALNANVTSIDIKALCSLITRAGGEVNTN